MDKRTMYELMSKKGIEAVYRAGARDVVQMIIENFEPLDCNGTYCAAHCDTRYSCKECILNTFNSKEYEV